MSYQLPMPPLFLFIYLFGFFKWEVLLLFHAIIFIKVERRWASGWRRSPFPHRPHAFCSFLSHAFSHSERRPGNGLLRFFFPRLRRIYPWLMLDHSELLAELSIRAKARKLHFSLHVLFLQPEAEAALGRSAESNNKSMIDITSHERPVSFSPLMGWKLLRWKRHALISLQVTMTTVIGSGKETQSVYLSKCQMLA